MNWVCSASLHAVRQLPGHERAAADSDTRRCPLLCPQLRAYLALKHPGLGSPEGGADADAALAASAGMTLAELGAAAQALAGARDLSAAEAELAAANLALVQAPWGGGEGPAAVGDGPAAAGPTHVWYGDPLLSSGESRHSVGGYAAMEALLVEQQRQDWSMFEYAGQLVCRDVEGWQVRRGRRSRRGRVPA